MIVIEPEAYVPRSALPKRELSRFLAQACERAEVSGEVTVLVTTDERMRELNRTFRRKNKPTDVLSFPPAPAAFAGDSSGGDLAISVDTALRQAQSLGHSLLVEVKILLLHGLLHLSGMDHERDTGQMGRREARLRRVFELPAGLIQRSVGATGKGVRAAMVPTCKAPTSQMRDVGHPGSVRVRGKKAAGGATKAAGVSRGALAKGARVARPKPARPKPARPKPARPKPARPKPARPTSARPTPARPSTAKAPAR